MNLVLKLDNQDVFYDCLVQYGVSKSHLNAMKCKILTKDINFTSFDTDSKRVELIPLDRIKYVRRISESGTVFEVIYNKLTYADKDSSSCSKLSSCFDYAEQQSLTNLLSSFENKDMMKAEGIRADCVQLYYSEDEQAYYVEEGNHRVLTAMIFNAPYIWCVVTDATWEKTTTYSKEESYLLSSDDKKSTMKEKCLMFLKTLFLK